MVNDQQILAPCNWFADKAPKRARNFWAYVLKITDQED